MNSIALRAYTIRRSRPSEYHAVGNMIVAAYASLPGMPQPAAEPDYYATLADVAKRNSNPGIRVFVATCEDDQPIASVDFIHDMSQYGAATSASALLDAAGIRLLAVREDHRGIGVGKALTLYCIEQARAAGKAKVVLHTTRYMKTAWSMYERMGFRRFAESDFTQGSLEVFGFKLDLERGAGPSG
jgi:GNAT superfamily N-acetyltransferase